MTLEHFTNSKCKIFQETDFKTLQSSLVEMLLFLHVTTIIWSFYFFNQFTNGYEITQLHNTGFKIVGKCTDIILR